MLTSFAKVQVADEALNRVQDRVKSVTDGILSSDVLDGRLVEASLVNGSFTPVAHGLVRPIKGYMVVRKDANAVVWDQGVTADADSNIWLQSSVAVNVTLWVF